MEGSLSQDVRALVYMALRDYAARFVKQMPPRQGCIELRRAMARIRPFRRAMAGRTFGNCVALEEPLADLDGREMFHQFFTDALDELMQIPVPLRCMGRAMQEVCTQKMGMYARPVLHGRITKPTRGRGRAACATSPRTAR